MTIDETLPHALALAERGWRVFPVGRDKKPLVKAWPTAATTDTEQVREWWAKAYRQGGIGIACGAASDLVVIDTDPRHGGDAGLVVLEERYGTLPPTVMVKTPGGGLHRYFKYPKDAAIRNKAGLAGASGVDIRGDGGYVVAPPSLHPNGGRYEWCSEEPNLADLPPAWVNLLAEPLPVTSADSKKNGRPVAALSKRTLDFIVNGAAEGKRNDELFRAAADMAGCGWTLEEATEKLLTGCAACSPPLTDQKEFKNTVASAFGKHRTPAVPAEARSPVLATRQRAWPKPPGAAAYYGLAGKIVRMVEPHTEADPAAILVQFHVAFGSVIGRSAHFRVEGDQHFTTMYAVLVGPTSKGRKGTSAGRTFALFGSIDNAWRENRVAAGGMSSGEGLIWAVRDPIQKREPVREGSGAKRRIVRYDDVEIDAGEPDKRLLIVESEFGGVLKVMSREGNTLSPVMRRAWDGAHILKSITKNSPATSTGAHISIVGHITKDELLRHLDDTEILNGLGNRFLWVVVRRSKCLPDGGGAMSGVERVVGELRQAIEFARNVDEVRRDDNARKLWHEVYPALSEGRPGLLGAALSRAEAQVMRLSVLYALEDQSEVIRREHLEAALALWEFCERSAEYTFGDALGDPVADTILGALRQNPSGLERRQIHELFGRHRRAGEIDRALGVLLQSGMARCVQRHTGGRPAELWIATAAPCEQSEKSEISPESAALNSHNSLNSPPMARQPADANIQMEGTLPKNSSHGLNQEPQKATSMGCEESEISEKSITTPDSSESAVPAELDPDLIEDASVAKALLGETLSGINPTNRGPWK
ncbi:MAG TPA: bifunctional DNA primase/polymerase [Phycisphaerae bacterium]|nr:bifunctional DNA primase/polymerase [Phycisphaerae bacterium]